MNKKHPTDRAERLRLNREKDFLKRMDSRLKPVETEKEYAYDLRGETPETEV